MGPPAPTNFPAGRMPAGRMAGRKDKGFQEVRWTNHLLANPYFLIHSEKGSNTGKTLL